MLAPPQSDLIVHSAHPLNAEPPLARLRQAFITPTADCYIRSHGAVPDIDPASHRLEIGGLVRHPLELSVDDLRRRFPSKSVMAVMQCAGNRRADLQAVAPTSGDPWAPGAIANVVWTGAALADVLRAAGADESSGLHVAFEAVDIAENKEAPDAPYGVSIPMAKALDPDVLLAWAMNGEPLSREHGAPLRAVVPGYAGVRSAKWLRRIAVQEEPSDAFQQRRDYLLFPPGISHPQEGLESGAPINEMPLNAAICEPEAGATLKAGPTLIRGYAIATDRAVTRVDVSADGGRHWSQASIENNANDRWSWTFWTIALDLPAGEQELVVRAWDAAGQTQPADPREVWNCKGYLCACWHRVQVRVV